MSPDLSAGFFLAYDDFMLNDVHRELSRRVFEWSLKCSRNPDPGEHARRAFLASTFGSFCAPRSASSDEVFTSIKFLVLFWQIDDASAVEIQDFIHRLNSDGGPAEGAAVGEFGQYYESLMAELDEATGFCNALHDLCVSVLYEKQSDKQDWTEGEMLRIRKIICGIPAFSECWRSIRGIRLSPPLMAAIQDALSITCVLASLVNDIASFDRDEKAMQVDPKSADANLVLLRMRTLGSRETALESGIRWYNSKVEEFHRTEQVLLHGEHGNDPALCAYLEIMHCAIVGDLATSKHLVQMRYEGSSVALSRLVKLDELG